VDSTKARWDTLRRTSVFGSGGFCRSRSAFWCNRATKHQRSIFYSRVGLVRIPQKRAGTRYAKFVFLHPTGYAGHVEHYGASTT
jgi:hypothetical protein